MADIQGFFYEGRKAHDFWQKHRDMKDADAFWGQMEFQFPMVAEYLKRTLIHPARHEEDGDKFAFGFDHSNGLAGLLDFGQDDDIRHMRTSLDYVSYSAEVWHFADWDPLMDFIELKFGARDCKWISDEYIEPFDLI